jgi:hypothetical protein
VLSLAFIRRDRDIAKAHGFREVPLMGRGRGFVREEISAPIANTDVFAAGSA